MKLTKCEKLVCVNCKELLIKIYPYCPGWQTPRMGLYCMKPKCQEVMRKAR
jgi:hypothetical protein